MANYVKVANASEVSPGEIKLVNAGGKELALVNLNQNFYALENECTHVGAPLCEGAIEGDEIICPWHGARFNILTGEVTEAPAPENLETYPVRVNNGDIEIEI
ncbi:MAG: non-heme iron oxygenase ferredoxin subunit [SAR324 cluster bacterium]|nr:non-heme iron oxygenase ferredoxin subunit [SAR324 cluster bacterium]